MEQNTHSAAPSHFWLESSAWFRVKFDRFCLHSFGADIWRPLLFQRCRCSIYHMNWLPYDYGWVIPCTTRFVSCHLTFACEPLQISGCISIKFDCIRVATSFESGNHSNDTNTQYIIWTDCHPNMGELFHVQLDFYCAISLFHANLCRFWSANTLSWFASVWRGNSGVITIPATQVRPTTPKPIAIRILER